MSKVVVIFAQTIAHAAGLLLNSDGQLLQEDKVVLRVKITDGRITMADHCAVMGWIVENMDGRAAIALRHAHGLDIDKIGPLGLAYKAAPDLRGSIHRLVRYFMLLSDSATYSLDPVGADHLLQLKVPNADHPALTLMAEAALALAVQVMRRISVEDVTPLAVLFRHDPPDDVHLLQDFFECEVRYGQTANGLLFSEETLSKPNRLGDAALSEFLTTHLEKERTARLPAKTLAERVLVRISKSLSEGVPKAANLAIELGMSERTLHRRLADDGHSYRDLCDRTRKTLATNLLRETEHSLAEVAFLTGFSEQSAFTRAFKRWQGQTPAEFRNIPTQPA